MPRISEDSREAIATPAASSDAELMRLPVDNLSIEVSRLVLTKAAAAAASSAEVFVAMEIAKKDPLAIIVSIACDRGDRYLSTGIFPA